MTNPDKRQIIFDALDKSNVSVAHFAKLAKTSRTSIYAWKRGNNINDQLRLDLAVNIARRIDKAVEQKLLPLATTAGMSPTERFAAVRRIIKEMG